MPYFPYSRQSKKKSHRGAITARMIANLMSVAGVNHVITIDLHASQMQGFFKCPVDNLVAEPILARWIRTNVKDWRNAVVVSKNPGGTKRVTSLADALKLSFGIVTTDRRRPQMPTSMFNSVIFNGLATDSVSDGPNGAEEDAEAHIYPYEPENVAAPIEHDFADGPPERTKPQEQDDRDHSSDYSRRPLQGLRATTSIAPNITSRLVNGDSYTPSSPLVQESRPDSSDGSHARSDDGSGAPSALPSLLRSHTAIGAVRAPQEESEAEDEEYTDEVRWRGVRI